jgi:hypothetical protein
MESRALYSTHSQDDYDQAIRQNLQLNFWE